MKACARRGFTLIELMMVVAILAMIVMIGLKSYGNLKLVQARKMNISNLKRIHNSMLVYDELARDAGNDSNGSIASGARTRFNYLDSLIEVPEATTTDATTGLVTTNNYGWANAGKAGTFEWTPGAETASSIIYDGNWKHASEEEQYALKLGNQGITSTLAGKIGLYYLNETDAKLLNEAGVSQILLHNWTISGNQTVNGNYPTGLISPGGGGPAWRPDMSAYYPVLVTNGTPVIVLRPDAAAAQTGYIYNHLGFQLTGDTADLRSTEKFDTLLKSTKLLLFGIGNGAKCVTAQYGLNEAPVNPVYDKYYYRNYFLVFAIKNGSTGHQSTCRIAGILDCDGLDIRGAQYNLDWQTSAD